MAYSSPAAEQGTLQTDADTTLHILKARGLTAVIAESCTAGSVASVLAERPDAGAVLEGGFVVYSKRQKTMALGVDPDLLQKEGAVSEEVVRQMASGALAHSHADIALSISGVLGPVRDEDDNPVGLVCFCAIHRDGHMRVLRKMWEMVDRDALCRLAVQEALRLLVAFAESLPAEIRATSDADGIEDPMTARAPFTGHVAPWRPSPH
jgi:nicotinamide-nucleotide amidase